MGYTVKKDGTRAWSTTELNCPQTAEGECICEDGKEEVTIFDKADQIVEAAANIDAAGGNENASLLDLAKMMPENFAIKLRPEPTEEYPFPSEFVNGYFYVQFQNLEAGDMLMFKADLSEQVDERLLPYINRAILSNYSLSDSIFKNIESTDADKHPSIGSGGFPFLINSSKDEAIRLCGLYVNYSSYSYRSDLGAFRDRVYNNTKEMHSENPLLGKKLSKIEDYGCYALTGIVIDSYKIRKNDEESVIKNTYDAFSRLKYSFMKYAYLDKGCVYVMFKVTNFKIDTSSTITGSNNYYDKEGYIEKCITIPKNEIIKAIEEEMKGK